MIYQTVSQMFNQITLEYKDRDLYYYKNKDRWKGIPGSEIRSTVKNLAFGFQSIEISKGSNVALLSNNSPRWAMGDYGIICSGAATVSVYPTLIASQVEYILNDSNSRVVIVENQEQLGKINEIWKNCPQMSHVIVLDESDESEDARIINFKDFLAMGSQFEKESGNNFEDLIKIAEPDDLLTLIYTSGTTGHPKGAMQSHKAVITNGAMTSQVHMRGPDDVVVSALPCPHVYANVLMTGMMMFGTKLVLHKIFDPAKVLQDITVHKATLFDGVPTMYMFMLNSPAFAEADLSSLKRCYVGGQTMPVATMVAVEKGFGVPLYELWGMTEIAGLGSTHPLYGKNKHGSIGCAIPYCELRIADVDDASKTTPGLLDY